MTKAQQKVLEAIRAALEATGVEYVSQGYIAAHLGKLPHPNTLDALVRDGKLITDPSVTWAQYKVA